MSRTSTAIRFSLLAVTLSLSINACRSTPQGNPVLVYGLTLSPSGLDPHINASAELGIPLRSVYDTLVYLDPDSGGFIPGLAENWSISADGLEYTFNLRSDVSFHDGTPFNAQAVKKNIEYTLDPAHHSQKAAGLLGPIEDVEVIDANRVVFHLNEPFAPLMDSLSQVYLGIASPKALEEWGIAEYQFHQVGTGPYRFVEYIPDDHILLERNDDYAWAPELYENQKAVYDRIEFRFFEDVATRAIALESGNVDILGEIPPLDAARLSEQDGFTLHPIPIPGQPLQYLFNTLKPPTDNLQVRTALIHAVDLEMIVDTVFGPTSPIASGPLSQEGFEDLLPNDIPAYNLDDANQILQNTGWRLHEDGIRRNASGDPFELVIVAPIWGSNPEVAQLLKVAWEAIGASVTLEIAPGFGPLRETQTAGDYNAIGINFFGTDPDLLRPMFSSDGLYNWTGYANSDLDQLLNRAAQASLNPELRKSLYHESIKHITDASLVLPVRDYVNLVVAESSINSLRYSASGWFPILIDLEPNS
jgi:peptide/nickel transport system substrate-binding protein